MSQYFDNLSASVHIVSTKSEGCPLLVTSAVMTLFALLLALSLALANDSVSIAKPYFIQSKDGTSLAQFKQWVQQLDGSAGFFTSDQNDYHQTYLTNLTRDIAAQSRRRASFRELTELGHGLEKAGSEIEKEVVGLIFKIASKALDFL